MQPVHMLLVARQTQEVLLGRKNAIYGVLPNCILYKLLFQLIPRVHLKTIANENTIFKNNIFLPNFVQLFTKILCALILQIKLHFLRNDRRCLHMTFIDY